MVEEEDPQLENTRRCIVSIKEDKLDSKPNIAASCTASFNAVPTLDHSVHLLFLTPIYSPRHTLIRLDLCLSLLFPAVIQSDYVLMQRDQLLLFEGDFDPLRRDSKQGFTGWTIHSLALDPSQSSHVV